MELTFDPTLKLTKILYELSRYLREEIWSPVKFLVFFIIFLSLKRNKSRSIGQLWSGWGVIRLSDQWVHAKDYFALLGSSNNKHCLSETAQKIIQHYELWNHKKWVTVKRRAKYFIICLNKTKVSSQSHWENSCVDSMTQTIVKLL